MKDHVKMNTTKERGKKMFKGGGGITTSEHIEWSLDGITASNLHIRNQKTREDEKLKRNEVERKG